MTSPQEYSARLGRFEEALGEEAPKLLSKSQTAVSRRSVQTYMQRDEIDPRDPSDTGPIRIQTSRLARSLTGAREGSSGRQEGISRIKSDGATVTLTMGTRVPYAATHEYGDTRTTSTGETATFPARPYLRPALEDETPTVRKIIEAGVIDALQKALSG